MSEKEKAKPCEANFLRKTEADCRRSINERAVSIRSDDDADDDHSHNPKRECVNGEELFSSTGDKNRTMALPDGLETSNVQCTGGDLQSFRELSEGEPSVFDSSATESVLILPGHSQFMDLTPAAL